MTEYQKPKTEIIGPQYDDTYCNEACKKHFGIGKWTPSIRAQNYSNIRKRLPNHFHQHQKMWLEDYEKSHGIVFAQERITKPIEREFA